MSKMYKTIKAAYDRGTWTKSMVWDAVAKGKITEAEYYEIISVSVRSPYAK